MLGDKTTTIKKCLGIGAVIQGAFFIGVSLVTLPTAFRVAEILYAEDFDRSGVIPTWFGPWHLAMWHPYFVTAVFLMLGAALAIAGSMFSSRGLGPQRWFERVLVFAMICCLILALALIPLSAMVSDWAKEMPAYQLRQTLLASTAAVWLELVVLLVTIVIFKRIGRPVA